MPKGPQRRPSAVREQSVVLPDRTVADALRRSLLRGLLAIGAGYSPKTPGPSVHRTGTDEPALLIYCVKGEGWCEAGNRRHIVHSGDMLVLPPRVPCGIGAKPSNAWTVHWAQAIGASVPEFLRDLGVSPDAPIVRVGDDLQLALLFDEVLQNLRRGSSFPSLLRASQALAHLLAVAIEHRHLDHREQPEVSRGFQKVGKCIEYMSEHLDRPLRVSALASLASLSPAHFAALFKEHLGSSPRDYLHLLRMHRACQWLTSTPMTLKEIASRLGYQDQFHFSRKFKAFSGVSPSGYRVTQPSRRYRNDASTL